MISKVVFIYLAIGCVLSEAIWVHNYPMDFPNPRLENFCVSVAGINNKWLLIEFNAPNFSNDDFCGEFEAPEIIIKLSDSSFIKLRSSAITAGSSNCQPQAPGTVAFHIDKTDNRKIAVLTWKNGSASSYLAYDNEHPDGFQKNCHNKLLKVNIDSTLLENKLRFDEQLLI